MLQVAKVGGSCLLSHTEAIADSLISLIPTDGPLVVSHGFGPRLRQNLSNLSINRDTFVSASGMHSHFTDETVLAASHLSAVQDQRTLLMALRARGATATGVMGFQQVFRGHRKKIRYKEKKTMRCCLDDYAGIITDVNIDAIKRHVVDTNILLIAPMIYTDDNVMLVCDSDLAAIKLASSLSATDLTLLTDVDGFIKDDVLLQSVSLEQIDSILAEATGGMRKKLMYAKKCLQSGVSNVRIRNGLVDQHNPRETVFHV